MEQKEYEELLKKAYKEIPDNLSDSGRFEVEELRLTIEGNKSIIPNFKKVAKQIHRDPEHMLRFFQKELAAPGKIINDRVIFGTKVVENIFRKKFKKYLGEFVFCSSCGKPDTKLQIRNNMQFIHCAACGKEHIVKSI